MANEIARRPTTSAEVDQVTQNYDPERIAGVWDNRPDVPPEVFPFLVLSMSRARVPLKSMPLFRYDAGITSDKSIFPFPRVEADDYADFAEEGLVQIRGIRRSYAQVWVPRRVASQKLHPPVLEALGTFMEEVGVNWDPQTLAETDINANFATLRAPISRQKVTMELGGPPTTAEASSLVAAGLRLALGATLVIQDVRDYQTAHPEQFGPIQS